MFKIFSFPALLLASLAIGAVLPNAAAADAGCVLCTQMVPQCNCAETQECTIIPQMCQECAHAVCVTPGTSS